jgi:hypothetical protein
MFNTKEENKQVNIILFLLAGLLAIVSRKLNKNIRMTY